MTLTRDEEEFMWWVIQNTPIEYTEEDFNRMIEEQKGTKQR